MSLVKTDGLGVALATPFKKDHAIDFNALDNLIDHVIEGGCDYIVVLGTTGETPTLTLEEKQKLASYIYKKVNGRLPLVIGIGGYCTHRVIHEINNIPLEGYSAILSVTPSYNKPTQEGLYQHFKAICDASPLPLMLYNVPGRTCVNLEVSTTLRLANYSDKIFSVKEASGNMKQCEDILIDAPESFTLISGNDGDVVEVMKLGGKGVISVMANAFPKAMKKLVDLCSEGKFKEAAELQHNFKPLIKTLFEEGNPSGVKFLLSRMGILDNILRLPLVPVSEHMEEKIVKFASEFSEFSK